MPTNSTNENSSLEYDYTLAMIRDCEIYKRLAFLEWLRSAKIVLQSTVNLSPIGALMSDNHIVTSILTTGGLTSKCYCVPMKR